MPEKENSQNEITSEVSDTSENLNSSYLSDDNAPLEIPNVSERDSCIKIYSVYKGHLAGEFVKKYSPIKKVYV